MTKIKRILIYLSYILRHKWFVFVECYREGLIWRGIIHDLSKFRPSEFFPYAYHDWNADLAKRDETGYYKPTDTGDKAFDFAWLLHQKRNRHHWQWWILPEDEGGIKILEMSDKYLLEMICDWKGAGRAQGNKTNCWDWYQHNKDKMQLNPKTRSRLEKLLI